MQPAVVAAIFIPLDRRQSNGQMFRITLIPFSLLLHRRVLVFLHLQEMKIYLAADKLLLPADLIITIFISHTMLVQIPADQVKLTKEQ